MTGRNNPFAYRTAATPTATTETADAPPAPTATAPAVASRGKKYPPKVTFYQPQDDTARMRGAFRHTDREEGDRSLSDFIHKAVMAEVERREKKYNSGKPFPDLEAGSIPRGRPMGE